MKGLKSIFKFRRLANSKYGDFSDSGFGCEIMILFILVFFKGFSEFNLNNIFVLNLDFGVLDLFLPYGAIIFSLWGVGLIPEAEEMIANKKIV